MSPDEFEGDTLSVEQPGGYDQLPTAAWIGGAKNGAMSPGDVVAYLAVRRFGTMRKGRAIPSRHEMADDMGITVRAVDDRLNGLIEGGWLLITPRYRDDGQGQTSNHYSLLWEPITSADDPRLVEHKRRVAAFEAWMAHRMAANAEEGKPAARPRSVRTAEWDADLAAKRQVYWGRRKLRGGQDATLEAPAARGAKETARGGEGNCAGPAQEAAPLGAKKTAPLESHPSHTLESHTNTAAGAAADVIPLFAEEPADQPEPPVPPAPEPSFEDFYARYPLKRDPRAAERAWGAAVRRGAAPSEVMTGVDAYIAWLDRVPRRREFIKYPATWLNAGSWVNPYDDEPSASGTARTNPNANYDGDDPTGGWGQAALGNSY